MMSASTSARNADKAYTAHMKANLTAVIDKLDKLDEIQKSWLKERWLDQVIWMEGRANRHRNRHYRLRIFAIAGGILIPLLITMSQNNNLGFLSWVAAGLGALVAISVAVEEFYHDGERWRNYRNSVELLKSEGWHFINLSGPYRHYNDADRSNAFKKFAARVEDIIQQDVQTYLGDIVGDSESGDKQAGEST
jgi:hypothetical protein